MKKTYSLLLSPLFFVCLEWNIYIEIGFRIEWNIYMEVFVVETTVAIVWGRKPIRKHLQVNYMEFSKHLENTSEDYGISKSCESDWESL